ncbi:MAG: hypothetical protein GX852_00445 [Clostridiales bacterium]|jgi:uncharacterized membrane protein HdeD (DUF308 family)|nr:hypothetical protein [Clostridiales bacterium]
MRTLMIATSLLMVGTGTFCVANASVAFASTAFLIGLALCTTGIVELFISYKTSINEDRGNFDTTVSGMIMLLVGVAILTGRITEDITACAVFAIIIARDGFLDLLESNFNLKENTREENTRIVLSVVSMALGIYMLFNSMVFNIPTLALIGVAIALMGFKRFAVSFMIHHVHAGVLKAREERLASAIYDEKKAMALAKRGIRESKEAQRRIAKIKEDIANEHKVMTDATIRAERKKAEEELEEARGSQE